MDQCATIRPFSSSQHKANAFILCGLTIKWPQNHFLSHFAPDKLLCQASAAWKTSGDTFPAVSRQEKSCFFLSSKSDRVCLWLTLSLMKNWIVSHAWSKLLTHYSQYCAREQSEMSAAHTVSLSEMNVPLWKRHRQFPNPTTLQSSAPCFFLGDTSTLMLRLYT